jgi:hypothetical protein
MRELFDADGTLIEACLSACGRPSLGVAAVDGAADGAVDALLAAGHEAVEVGAPDEDAGGAERHGAPPVGKVLVAPDVEAPPPLSPKITAEFRSGHRLRRMTHRY